MGWLGRETNVNVLISDIKDASRLPLDQGTQLASEMEEFIEEIRSVMQTPDHPSELMRLFQSHGAMRKALASGGPSAQWAHHAFRESYLLALIKAPNDPKWFREVHTLLYGIRGPLNLVGVEPEPDGPYEMNTTAEPKPRRVTGCDDCGGKVSTRAKACPHCGSPVGPQITCPDCGEDFAASLTSCPGCGCPVAIKEGPPKDKVDGGVKVFQASPTRKTMDQMWIERARKEAKIVQKVRHGIAIVLYLFVLGTWVSGFLWATGLDPSIYLDWGEALSTVVFGTIIFGGLGYWIDPPIYRDH